MPRKIVRASEYWNEEAPRPVRVSGRDWQDLVRGPSVQPGLLHFAASDNFQDMEIDYVQDLADSGHPGARSYLEKFYEKPEGYFTDENYSGPGIPDRANNPYYEGARTHFAAGDVADPSMPEEVDPDEERRKAMQKIREMPGLRDISQSTTGGGAHGDGTPENWPGQLPGDQIMGDVDQAIGGIMNTLPGLLGKGK